MFSDKRFSDEELIEAADGEWNFHMFRIMEGRSRSTCSGVVCQLVINPRVTERFMVEEGYWQQPRLVGADELLAIFVSYCISMDASDRMRIIGICNVLWEYLGEWADEDPHWCTPVGEMNRDPTLLGEEMPESIDPDEHPEIKMNTWVAAKIILDDTNRDGFRLFLWKYMRLIDSENTFLRLQYAIGGLESLMPSETGNIRASLLRRASIMAFDHVDINEEGKPLSDWKKIIGELITICNKVKHNIIFNDKEWEIYRRWIKSVPILFNFIFNRIVHLGRVPSVTEIDLAEESGFISETVEFTSIFTYDQYFNQMYRYDWLFDSERVQRWEDLGGAENMDYNEFVISEVRGEYPIERQILKAPRRSIIEALISSIRGFFQRAKKYFENQDDTDTDNERPMYREWKMLLGVPMVKDENGDQVRWLEIFPGIHIHWSDNIYEDDEIKSRCNDELDFNHFKIMEIFSRETNSGWICDLELDCEDTIDFLESNGMGHLSNNVDNIVQSHIFRVFTAICAPFNGTRLMCLYNRFWPILLDDDFWDEAVSEEDFEAKIIPLMDMWTLLLEDDTVWSGVEHNTISLDLWYEWKPIVWRMALMMIEDEGEGGRLSKSADEPLHAFLFSRDVDEKNANFIQILSTLLRPSRNGPRLHQSVSAIAAKNDENKDDMREYIANLVSDSIECRDDFFHGRLTNIEKLNSISSHQHHVINRLYNAIILHGGIPNDDVIASAIEGKTFDYKDDIYASKYGLKDSRDDEIIRYNSKYGSGSLAHSHP